MQWNFSYKRSLFLLLQPDVLRDLKYAQSDSKCSEKALDSTGFRQVSITQRESTHRGVKKSFKTKVLFANNLAFTRAIIVATDAGVLAIWVVQHNGTLWTFTSCLQKQEWQR